MTPETGVVVDAGDIEGTMETVRMIESRGKDAYRDVCRRWALGHFRKEDRYRDYIDLYESLLPVKQDR